MRDPPLIDGLPVSGDLVLCCPPRGIAGPAETIRARGNCPLDINGTLMAELPMADLRDSWSTTRKLTPRQVHAMTQSLGRQLSDAGQADLLDSRLADAAAFFLLALRHNRATPDRAIEGCRVIWHAEQGTDEVEWLA